PGSHPFLQRTAIAFRHGQLYIGIALREIGNDPSEEPLEEARWEAAFEAAEETVRGRQSRYLLLGEIHAVADGRAQFVEFAPEIRRHDAAGCALEQRNTEL